MKDSTQVSPWVPLSSQPRSSLTVGEMEASGDRRLMVLYETNYSTLDLFLSLRPKRLLIHSGGGRCDAALEIVRHATLFGTDIKVRCAYSAGVIYALANGADVSGMYIAQFHGLNGHDTIESQLRCTELFMTEMKSVSNLFKPDAFSDFASLVQQNILDKDVNEWERIGFKPHHYWFSVLDCFNPYIWPR